MYQLRNLINRSGIGSNPEKKMKASEDFLLLLLHAHVIAAAEKLCEYDIGSASVADIAQSIISTHLLLPTAASTVQDGVTTYARELLTLGLIWHHFYDAIKEGDGDRILNSLMENDATDIQGHKSHQLSQGGSKFIAASKGFLREESRSTALVTVHQHTGKNGVQPSL